VLIVKARGRLQEEIDGKSSDATSQRPGGFVGWRTMPETRQVGWLVIGSVGFAMTQCRKRLWPAPG
jgi:hypothetical protein